MKKGRLDKIADYILDGKHDKLLGIKSDTPAVQDFLDKIPFYAVCIKLLICIYSFKLEKQISQFTKELNFFFATLLKMIHVWIGVGWW